MLKGNHVYPLCGLREIATLGEKCSARNDDKDLADSLCAVSNGEVGEFVENGNCDNGEICNARRAFVSRQCALCFSLFLK